ncbi:MAG: hypothetical protein K6G85_09195 [Eubacterium sp.]|nr:hypothetical protein [Eubacterium sp.]
MGKIGFIVVGFIIFDLILALFFYITYIRDARAKQLKAFQEEKENEDEDDFELMMQKIIEQDRQLKEEEKKKKEVNEQ